VSPTLYSKSGGPNSKGPPFLMFGKLDSNIALLISSMICVVCGFTLMSVNERFTTLSSFHEEIKEDDDGNSRRDF
jgi:hypothetical protein